MSDTTPQIEHEPYCDGWACAACNTPDDIPPEHAIPSHVSLAPDEYAAVMALVENPPPPTPALVALMARCRAVAPAEHARAGAQCEREPHAVGNHRVSPRDGLPGAVWSDARSREDGGS